jgi:SAM-dependent methyltransferase
MKKNIPIIFVFSLLVSLSPLAQEPSYQEAFRWDVPYVPTPQEVVDEMLAMADIGPNDILYDLGCGDGRIVITAAKKFGIKGIGVDIDPTRITECHVNAVTAQVEDQVTFVNEDLFAVDFSEASVLTLYLLNSVNLRLRPYLFEQLKPGTRVVSHDFSMGEWEPDEKTDLFAEHKYHYIFFWIMPANCSGHWSLTLPSALSKSAAILEIEQTFQKAEGFILVKNSQFPIEEARIKGDNLTFKLVQKGPNTPRTWIFEGKAEAHSLKGTVYLDSPEKQRKLEWKAERDPESLRPLDPETDRERSMAEVRSRIRREKTL